VQAVHEQDQSRLQDLYKGRRCRKVAEERSAQPVAVSSFRKREFALGHLHISPTAGKVPLSRRWVGRDRANLGERHFGLRHFTAQFGLGTRSGVPDING
jgi:hypothetical protein